MRRADESALEAYFSCLLNEGEPAASQWDDLPAESYVKKLQKKVESPPLEMIQPSPNQRVAQSALPLLALAPPRLAEEKRQSLQNLLLPPLVPKEETPPLVDNELVEVVIAKQNSTFAEPADVLAKPANAQEGLPSVDSNQEKIESPGEDCCRDLTWHTNGRPNWAQEPFDVLIVQVSGLSLAVPLVTLGQIFPLTEELTPIFGRAPWFMGLLPTAAGKLSTVNSALYVMPERYQAQLVENYHYVVSLCNSTWGLAVDSVNQPIRLQPEDVTWRPERKSRPWLAGTVKSAMCALVDIPNLTSLLNKTQTRAPKTL